MRKLVRKVKKINVKVLFASLLIAVIAVTGGVALMGSKDTAAYNRVHSGDLVVNETKVVRQEARKGNQVLSKITGCSIVEGKDYARAFLEDGACKVKATKAGGTVVVRVSEDVQGRTKFTNEYEYDIISLLTVASGSTITISKTAFQSCISENANVVEVSGSDTKSCTLRGKIAGSSTIIRVTSLGSNGSEVDAKYKVQVGQKSSSGGGTSSSSTGNIYLNNNEKVDITVIGGSFFPTRAAIESGSSIPKAITAGKNFVFPTAQSTDGNKNFAGWVPVSKQHLTSEEYRNACGTSTRYYGGNTISIQTGEEQNFVACFESRKNQQTYPIDKTPANVTTYSVIFDGGTPDAKLTCNTGANQRKEVASNGTNLCKVSVARGGMMQNPYGATREGYAFAGWLVSGMSAPQWAGEFAVTNNMYLVAQWVPVASAPMGCTSSTGQTSSTGVGTITHCIPTVCSNGVIKKDNIPNLSGVTCASGYTKDESQVALISTSRDAGSCSQQVGSSCNWSGKGTCYDKYSYACVLKASLSLKQKTVTLQQGQSADLKSYINYSGVDSSHIDFVSSNPNVATVDGSGRVTARKSGRATIYVQIGSVRDSIDVVVGEAANTCENSHTEPITAYEGDEGIVTHCLKGTCSQYGGYTFQTTAPSDFVINCVTGQKKVEMIYSSCEQLEGVCSPNDKVNCTQRWYWQCVPDTSRREYHTVTFVYGNDAGDVQDVKVADGALAPNIHPYRNNYTFLGWYYTSGSTNSAYVVDLESSVITEDMTLYAHWKFNGSNNSDSENQLNVSGKDAPTCTLSVNTNDWAPKKTLGVTVNKGKYELADLPFNYTYNNGSLKGHTSYTANTSIEIDMNGKYAVTVKDERGNTSTCSYTENRIDNEKPSVTTFGYQEGSMEISISATDAQSGIKGYYYSQLSTFPTADSAGWQTSPTMKVTEIAHYFGWVMDNAGNISERVKIEAGHNISAPDATMSTFNITAEGLVDHTSTVSGAALENQRKANYKVMQLSKPADLMAFNFNPLKTFYEVSVTSGKISFYATLPKGSSFVEGYEPKENYPLEYGLNTVLIKVKDSHGIVRTYTILVTRVDNRSGVNLLSNLSVSEGSIEFTPYQTEYTVKVGKNVDRVSINATLTSASSSFVEGFGPREISLEDGQIDAQIKVRSASGTERTYTIHFYRNADVPSQSGSNKSGSTFLSSLSVVGANLVFDKETLHYNVSVGYDVHSVTVYAFAEDKAATVKVSGGGSLRVGENIVTVSVTGTNGRTRTYTIVVIRKEDELGLSSNTELSMLSIGGYDIKFRPDKTNYELKVDREKTLVIMATPKSDRSNVYIVGNEDLSTFSTLKISVVAEDGTTDVYSIDISKDAWNTRLEVIIAAIGLTIAVGATVFIQVRRKQKRKALNID